MILNYNNEIDKQLAEKFSEQTIQNIKFGTLGYLCVNITSAPDTNFDFKMYYDLDYSLEQYNKTKHSIIVNDLLKKNLIKSIEIAHNENNKECNRFNLKLNRSNNKITELFTYLSTKIPFWGKYSDEIQKLSQMKISEDENQSYAALMSLGFLQNKNVISILKCYWSCKHRENSNIYDNHYYLKFLKENSYENISNIVKIAEELLTNCEAKLWMFGNDYKEECSLNAKIYIADAANLYSGLSKTFINNLQMTQKIQIIEDWNKVHPEFYCDGIAIGENSQNEITLNFYFKLKMNKLKKLITKMATKQSKMPNP